MDALELCGRTNGEQLPFFVLTTRDDVKSGPISRRDLDASF